MEGLIVIKIIVTEGGAPVAEEPIRQFHQISLLRVLLFAWQLATIILPRCIGQIVIP